MDIREELKTRGATDQQLESKIFGMVESVLIDATGEELTQTGYTVAKNLANKLDGLISDASRTSSNFKVSEQRLRDIIWLADEKIKEVKTAAVKLTSANAQAMAVFDHIIKSVKDVFGEENMTEAVMCTAIEAGSFGVWRSIMGESKPLVETKGKRY